MIRAIVLAALLAGCSGAVDASPIGSDSGTCAMCIDLTMRCSPAPSSTVVSCPAACKLTPATWYGTDATSCALLNPDAGDGQSMWCCQ